MKVPSSNSRHQVHNPQQRPRALPQLDAKQQREQQRAREYVFDPSPANSAHVDAVIQLYIAGRGLSPQRQALVQALSDVAYRQVSVADACDRYQTNPTILVRLLYKIPTRTPEQTFARMQSVPLRDLTYTAQRPTYPGEPRVQEAVLQPPTPPSASLPHSRPASRPSSQPPEIAFGNEARPDEVENLDLFDIATSFGFDAELEALLHFDAFVDPTQLEPIATPTFEAFEPFEASQASPAPAVSISRLPTPLLQQVSELMEFDASALLSAQDVEASQPDAATQEALEATSAVVLDVAAPPIEQPLHQSPLPSDVAQTPGPMAPSVSQSISAAQHYAQAHPNDGRVVFVTKQMMSTIHSEFLTIAASSGHRVHAHKMSLFHAMIDVCHGATLFGAAQTKFVAPQALLGVLHCLHAASPIDVFQWLKEPSTEQSAPPPGAGVVLVIQDLDRSKYAAQLAPHRFEPHAKMYQQHPLPAGPNPMWQASQVGAQAMPQY